MQPPVPRRLQRSLAGDEVAHAECTAPLGRGRRPSRAAACKNARNRRRQHAGKRCPARRSARDPARARRRCRRALFGAAPCPPPPRSLPCSTQPDAHTPGGAYRSPPHTMGRGRLARALGLAPFDARCALVSSPLVGPRVLAGARLALALWMTATTVVELARDGAAQDRACVPPPPPGRALMARAASSRTSRTSPTPACSRTSGPRACRRRSTPATPRAGTTRTRCSGGRGRCRPRTSRCRARRRRSRCSSPPCSGRSSPGRARSRPAGPVRPPPVRTAPALTRRSVGEPVGARAKHGARGRGGAAHEQRAAAVGVPREHVRLPRGVPRRRVPRARDPGLLPCVPSGAAGPC
jgi:hypothetical protein